MEKLGYIIPRLFMGVVVQVLCSYSTLPLYALVTQMGSMFKEGIFNEFTHGLILDWRRGTRTGPSNTIRNEPSRMAKESFESVCIAEQSVVVDEGYSTLMVGFSSPNQTETSSVEFVH
ncbi:unnamed protein product [Ilex paraguariensis]|uniref:Uncharacterized protein n=1 Tax=Ilex paraguariensis TaxID=185542 RepID=A0ABC8ULF4_9AQUA